MPTLIDLLEEESKAVQAHPEKPFLNINENEIDAEIVFEVYLEVEKLIRVIANIVKDQSSHQAINQLRYAGHHLLKHLISDSQNKKDLVEAYKHCIRAYYDMLDYYVLKMGDIFTAKLSLLQDNEKMTALKQKINAIFEAFQTLRFNENNRADYYQEVRKHLINGLRLIEEVDKILLDFGYSEQIFRDKNSLIEENTKLHKVIDESLKKVAKNTKKANSTNLWLSIGIAVATMTGLAFQGSLTDYFRSPIVNVEHSLKHGYDYEAFSKKSLQTGLSQEEVSAKITETKNKEFNARALAEGYTQEEIDDYLENEALKAESVTAEQESRRHPVLSSEFNATQFSVPSATKK